METIIVRFADNIVIGDELLIDTNSGLRPDKVVDIVNYTLEGTFKPHMYYPICTVYRS